MITAILFLISTCAIVSCLCCWRSIGIQEKRLTELERLADSKAGFDAANNFHDLVEGPRYREYGDLS